MLVDSLLAFFIVGLLELFQIWTQCLSCQNVHSICGLKKSQYLLQWLWGHNLCSHSPTRVNRPAAGLQEGTHVTQKQEVTLQWGVSFLTRVLRDRCTKSFFDCVLLKFLHYNASFICFKLKTQQCFSEQNISISQQGFYCEIFAGMCCGKFCSCYILLASLYQISLKLLHRPNPTTENTFLVIFKLMATVAYIHSW